MSPQDTSPEAAIGYPLATNRASFGRDALTLPTGTVVDLAGNLSEWALDWFQGPSEACWSSEKVYENPLCNIPGMLFPSQRAVRGASFVSAAGELAAARRDALDPTTITPVVGFRCARPD